MLNSFSVRHKGAIRFANRKAQASKTNRRATSYLPDEKLSPDPSSNFFVSTRLPILPQLLRLEAERLSGCIKMESHITKSRSAMLFYKGNVIASLYGSKKIPEQVFGDQALEKSLIEIGAPGTELKSYMLSEDLVLAAATMFRGGVYKAEHEGDAPAGLINCMRNIENTAAPGSIAVLDPQNTPVCILYVAAGKVLGMNVLSEELKGARGSALIKYLKKNPQTQLLSNSLSPDSCATIELYAAKPDNQSHSTLEAAFASDKEIAKLVSVYSVSPTERPNQTRSDRFVPRNGNQGKRYRLSGWQTMPFIIDPQF